MAHPGQLFTSILHTSHLTANVHSPASLIMLAISWSPFSEVSSPPPPALSFSAKAIAVARSVPFAAPVTNAPFLESYWSLISVPRFCNEYLVIVLLVISAADLFHLDNKRYKLILYHLRYKFRINYPIIYYSQIYLI